MPFHRVLAVTMLLALSVLIATAIEPTEAPPRTFDSNLMSRAPESVDDGVGGSGNREDHVYADVSRAQHLAWSFDADVYPAYTKVWVDGLLLDPACKCDTNRILCEFDAPAGINMQLGPLALQPSMDFSSSQL